MTTNHHVALAADIRRLLRIRLLDPLEIALGEFGDQTDRLAGLDRSFGIQAETWAARLLGPDDALAVATAARLIAVLYGADEPFDPPRSWWATPLGRAVAARAGHPRAETVSFGAAAAMLGITRQGVADLVRRGKLVRHTDGKVTSASVAARLRRTAEKGRGHVHGDRIKGS